MSISSSTTPNALTEKVQEQSLWLATLTSEVNKVIVGQANMVEKLLIGLLSGGHILLEGVPGLAKTLAIKTLSSAIHAKFSRIQFTPDLLPADVVGTMIYNLAQNEFLPKKGPVFANFVLADEINRAPEKVQSALLEAMAEKQVTIGDQTFKLDEPFLVLATQNPIEQGGTYPLPEAQADRFLLKVLISYPGKEDERLIIRQHQLSEQQKIQVVLKPEQLLEARQTVKSIYMDEKVEDYILNLIFATRQPESVKLEKLKPLLSFGASPRGSIGLTMAAKAHAFLQQRAYVTPDDVRAVVAEVLRHRIGLSYEAQAETILPDDVIREILNAVPMP
ncbi:MoxR family ATPase [Cytophagaceae bacterium YF14B1]|uniref:MoxR family ATPase n=1 Tax=Xanthocytophaga flava TaxID=3048013 RepID=A0AAE3U7T6_9BACT|nr:MoxR family ATPase [Xanthocytophaga flavus]MDJ1481967.1 MoxR family ATPase [Xanthocytophaga flavus]